MSEAQLAQPTAAPVQFAGRAYYRAGTLGEGAFGAVCVAYDDDGHEYAVKQFNKWGADGEDWDEDEEGEDPGLDVGVLREVAMLKLLNGAHENILTVIDVSTMDGATCMVMPKLAGTLAGAIEKQTLSNKDKLRVAAIALHALAFLHSHGIIHRDLKPDNLLLTEDNAPVLADFSLAKVINAAEPAAAAPKADGAKKAGKAAKKRKQQQQANAAADAAPAALTAGAGTPTYTAPEIVEGKEYGLKADVFSMGVVLYELFHGRAAGSGLDAWKDKHALAQVGQIRQKLSDKPLPSLLKAMLAADPEERPSAAEALRLLPGHKKLVAALRTPGRLFDMPAAPEAAPPADDAAPVGGKRRGGGGGGAQPKRRKGGGGAEGGEALGAGRICELLDAVAPQSTSHAAAYHARSAVARGAGLDGAAVCALLALKMFEPEVFAPSDLREVEALDDVDVDALPARARALELEVLNELGYALLHAPAPQDAAAPAGLSERN